MTYVKGLEGIIAAETKVGHVDGEKGQLIYRGYWAKDLAIQIDFRSYCSEHTRLIPDLHQLNNWLISYHKGVEVNVDA